MGDGFSVKRADGVQDAQLREWLEAAADGETDAFAALYDEFAPRLYGYLRLRLSDVADVQDLMQDTFVTLWRSAASYAGTSTVATWIFGIARHKLLDWLRRQKKWTQLEVSWLDDLDDRQEPASGDFAGNVITEVSVAQALAALPPHYAELFYLASMESLSTKEMSLLLNVPEGTVKSRMYHVRSWLRQQLTEGDKCDESGHVS